MKKIMKTMLCILGTLIALMAVIWFSFVYVTDYKKTTCDITTSPEGKHELILQAVGEPDWPFGLACGRLIPAK